MPKSPLDRIAWLKRLAVEVENLYAALERERDALKERYPEAIMEAVAEKNAMVERIQGLMMECSGWIDPRDPLMRVFEDLEPNRHDQAMAIWAEVCHWAVRCRALNEANGAVIALLQEHNREALALFLDREPFNYGADGQVRVEGSTRLLGAT
ncbi:MAG: flagellar protein FlgN [Methylohalobius sp.]|nr:flagellar protein FlgN [Methylohalobius sp.]